MALDMHIMDSKNKDIILFDTKDLKRFTLEQLQVLRQQIGWEIQKKEGESNGRWKRDCRASKPNTKQ